MTNRPGSGSPWTTTSTRTVYENPWITVREDEVIRPDGAPGLYGVVSTRHPAVFVVALTNDDEILMVTLHRYATADVSLEVVAGGTDGEEPLDAARRELLEETGYTAGQWRQIGRMNILNGVCDALGVVYLATDLTPPTPGGDAYSRVVAEQRSEGIDSLRAVPWDELMTLVESGGISDSETVASLMFAALALGRLGAPGTTGA